MSDQEEECKHEMPLSWCADCSGRRGIELEVEQEEEDFDNMLRRWSNG